MKENNKFRMLWVSIGLLLLMNIGMMAWFTFFGKMPPRRLFLEKELEFTAKQEESYRDLRKAHSDKMKVLKDNVKNLKEDFYANLSDFTITDAELKEKAVAMEANMVEADILTFKHFQEVRKMCTPKQQERFDDIIIDVIRSIERPGGGPPMVQPQPREGGRPPLKSVPSPDK